MTAKFALFESRHSQSMHFTVENSILLETDGCCMPYIDILLYYKLPSGVYVDTFEISRWPGFPMDWQINVIESNDSTIHCEHIANDYQSMQFALELLSFPILQHENLEDERQQISEGSCQNKRIVWLNFTLPFHKQYHRITELKDTHSMQLLAPLIFAKSGTAHQPLVGPLRERLVDYTLLKDLAVTGKRMESAYICAESLPDSYSVIRPQSFDNVSFYVHMPTAMHTHSEWIISSAICVQLLAALVLSVILIIKL